MSLYDKIFISLFFFFSIPWNRFKTEIHLVTQFNFSISGINSKKKSKFKIFNFLIYKIKIEKSISGHKSIFISKFCHAHPKPPSSADSLRREKSTDES